MSLANERMLEPHFDSDGIFEEVGYYHNFKDIGGNVDLSSRTPVARMWTALSFFNDVEVEGGETLVTDTEISDFYTKKKSYFQSN